LPAVVVAPTLVPFSSASALACHRLRPRCRRRRPRPRRPTAALAIPSTSVIQRRHNYCHHQAVFAAAAAATAANLVLFGRSNFSQTEELVTNKSKAKECNLIFTAQLLRKMN